MARSIMAYAQTVGSFGELYVTNLFILCTSHQMEPQEMLGNPNALSHTRLRPNTCLALVHFWTIY